MILVLKSCSWCFVATFSFTMAFRLRVRFTLSQMGHFGSRFCRPPVSRARISARPSLGSEMPIAVVFAAPGCRSPLANSAPKHQHLVIVGMPHFFESKVWLKANGCNSPPTLLVPGNRTSWRDLLWRLASSSSRPVYLQIIKKQSKKGQGWADIEHHPNCSICLLFLNIIKPKWLMFEFCHVNCILPDLAMSCHDFELEPLSWPPNWWPSAAWCHWPSCSSETQPGSSLSASPGVVHPVSSCFWQWFPLEFNCFKAASAACSSLRAPTMASIFSCTKEVRHV